MKRMKIADQGCYYHLMNRVSGYKGDLPFASVDREYGFTLLQNLTEYFLVEVISAAWMGNHFHLVVYAPGKNELPSEAAIAARHNAYYKSMEGDFTYAMKKMPYIEPKHKKLCREVGEKMIDISYFMRAYQQRFSVVFNRTYNHIGRLWADRFKSVILEGADALEACLQYVELNPVRAKLTENPADYRFTTWGRYSGSGKHAYHANFIKHYKKLIDYTDTSSWSDADFYTEFKCSLTRIIAAERGANAAEIAEAEQIARRKESMPVRFLKRTRHFTDGAILGSKHFIRETARKFDNPDRVEHKQLSRGLAQKGTAIYCFRKLIL